ncbi:MAG: Ig-like domain-containing protein [archaeon]
MKKRGMTLLLVVALALIYLSIQLNAETLPTELEINYNNTPPTLIQYIPDQYLAINIDKLNAFDLDDYFIDNETLTYTIEITPVNVTALIDADNVVSFYPDTDWNGTTNITFKAYDGFDYTTSNLVIINVSEDTEPPQWSDPTINFQGTTIYQNVYVNFSTTWTDNYALGSFTFSINSGGGWSTYPAELMTGVQNTSRYRVQISSSGGTNYWKFGAYDASGNYNETDVQNFTVATTPSPPTGTTGSDRDSSPSREGGYAPASSQTGIDQAISGFTVSPESFNLELKQGSSVTATIKITNTGNDIRVFSIVVSGLDLLDKTLSAADFNLSGGESKTVSVMFTSSEEVPIDMYFGKIIVSSSNESIEVPTVIGVRAAITNLDMDLTVLEDYKQIRPGKPTRANITITNIEEIEAQELVLYYALIDFEGNILTSNTETFEFADKSIELEKELIVPDNAPRGEYIFFARATNEGDTTISSDTFFVGSRFTVMGFIRANLLLMLIIIASIIVALLMVKHYRNQERLRLLNLYIMITNLKKLLKEGEIEKAIKLYIRIKSSYGQPVSRSALQNKDALKQEMEKLTEKLHSPGVAQQVQKAQEVAKKKEGPEIKPEEDKPGEEKKEEPKQEEKKEEQPIPEKKTETKPAPKPEPPPTEQAKPAPKTEPEKPEKKEPPKTETKAPLTKPAIVAKPVQKTESKPKQEAPKEKPENKTPEKSESKPAPVLEKKPAATLEKEPETPKTQSKPNTAPEKKTDIKTSEKPKIETKPAKTPKPREETMPAPKETKNMENRENTPKQENKKEEVKGEKK